MQFLLKCCDGLGSVAFPASIIEGLPVVARKYDISNNQVILEGYPDAVLHSDADELLAMPGGLFRMPTPAEQDAFVQAMQAKQTVQEDAAPALEEDTAAVEPPKKAKANGG